jgi:hypothetical protein
MGKKFKLENRPKVVLDKVTCDECEEDCTNTYFDILVKASFSDKEELSKTLCWKCWEKEFVSKGESK